MEGVLPECSGECGSGPLTYGLIGGGVALLLFGGAAVFFIKKKRDSENSEPDPNQPTGYTPTPSTGVSTAPQGVVMGVAMQPATTAMGVAMPPALTTAQVSDQLPVSTSSGQTQRLQVEVPKDLQGRAFQINHQGQMMTVQVPAHVQPGSQMTIEVPANMGNQLKWSWEKDEESPNVD